MSFLLDRLNYAVEWFRRRMVHPIVSVIVWLLEVIWRFFFLVPHPVKPAAHQFKEEDKRCCVNNSTLSFFDRFLCINGVPAHVIDRSDATHAPKDTTTSHAAGTSKDVVEDSTRAERGAARNSPFVGRSSETVVVCAFSNDGTKIAVCYVSGDVTIWDADHGSFFAETRVEGSPATNVSFLGTKNSVLLIYTMDYTCWKWDIDANSPNLTKICDQATSSEIDGEVISRRSNFYKTGERLLLSTIINAPSGALLEIASLDLSATRLWLSYSVPIKKNYVISKTMVSHEGTGILVGLMDSELDESYCLLWPSYNEAPASSKTLDKGTIGSWSIDSKHVVTWFMTNTPDSDVGDGNSAFIWNVEEMRENLKKFEYSFKPRTITNPFGGKVLWCQMTEGVDEKDRLIMSIGGEFTRVLFWDVETSTHTHTIETGISPKDMMLCNKEAWIESCVNEKSVKGLCPMDVTSDGGMFGAVLGLPSELLLCDAHLGIEVLRISIKDVIANKFRGGINLIMSPSNSRFAIVGNGGVIVFCPSLSKNEERAKNCLETQMVQFDNPHVHQDNLSRFKMSFSGDGDSLGVLCIGSSQMQVYNLLLGTSYTVKSAYIKEGAHIQDFCLSNNGKYIALYTKKNVQVWNCVSGKVASIVDMTTTNCKVVAMGINDDASEVLTCMKDGSISLYELPNDDIHGYDEAQPSRSSSQRHDHDLSLVKRFKEWFKRPREDIRQELISKRERDGPSLARETSIDIHEGPMSSTYPSYPLAEESNEATFQVSPDFEKVIRISETNGVEVWDLKTKEKRRNRVNDVASIKRSSYGYSHNSSITQPVHDELMLKKDQLLKGTSIDFTKQTTLVQSSRENIIVAGNSSLQAFSQRKDKDIFDFEYDEKTYEDSHSIYVINLNDAEYRRRLSGRNLDPGKGLAISHDGRHVACLAGDFGSKVVAWNVYASERLLPDYNFLSLTLAKDMSRKEGIKRDIVPLIQEFGINFFNFQHPSGMSVFEEAICQFNNYLLKAILQYAMKKNIRVSFLFSKKTHVWTPMSNYHDVVEALVARRLPKTLIVMLKYLFKRVTYEAEVDKILKHSLVIILHVYPNIFVRTIRDSRLLGTGFEVEIPETSLEGRKFKASTSNSLNLSKEETQDFWDKDLGHEEKVSMYPMVSSKAGTLPYEGACDIGNNGILRKLLIYGVHEHAYGSFVIGAIVAYKWSNYARELLLQELTHHGMVCVSFTIYSFVLVSGVSNKINSDQEHEDHSKLMTISLAVCCALAAMCLYRELWQCATYIKEHGLYGLVYWVKSAWNWIEVFSYINVVFIIPLGQWVFVKEGSYRAILSALVSVESLLLWSRMLFYARPFDHTGPLVVTISAIVREICYFLILALSVMFGFALAFCVLYRTTEFTDADTSNANVFNYEDEHHSVAPDDVQLERMDQAFGTFRRSFFTIFGYTFGDFDLENLYQAPEPHTALILFVLYVFSLSIILLNMLIALMSEKFTRIYEKRKTRVIEARARAIDDIDSMLSNKSKDNIREGIGKYLQVIVPSHHHERVTKGCRLRQTQSKLRDEINAAMKRNLHDFGKNVILPNRFAPRPLGKDLASKDTAGPSRRRLEPPPEDGPVTIADFEAEERHEYCYVSDSTDSNFSISDSEDGYY